jgi:hypothetical protein
VLWHLHGTINISGNANCFSFSLLLSPFSLKTCLAMYSSLEWSCIPTF